MVIKLKQILSILYLRNNMRIKYIRFVIKLHFQVIYDIFKCYE